MTLLGKGRGGKLLRIVLKNFTLFQIFESFMVKVAEFMEISVKKFHLQQYDLTYFFTHKPKQRHSSTLNDTWGTHKHSFQATSLRSWCDEGSHAIGGVQHQLDLSTYCVLLWREWCASKVLLDAHNPLIQLGIGGPGSSVGINSCVMKK